MWVSVRVTGSDAATCCEAPPDGGPDDAANANCESAFVIYTGRPTADYTQCDSGDTVATTACAGATCDGTTDKAACCVGAFSSPCFIRSWVASRILGAGS